MLRLMLTFLTIAVFLLPDNSPLAGKATAFTVIGAGAEAEDVGPAAKLLQNSRVHHYWNPNGSFGRELADAVALESDGKPVYAWDVWLIYGPEATWNGAIPPRPVHLMHQLYELQDSETFPQLDREVFARDVQQLLAELPPPAVSGQ
jgi:hypothetical protein